MTLGRAKRGWFDRKRVGRHQRSAHVEAPPNPDHGVYRHTIERLENRILMSADPLHFIAAPNIAQDLTLESGGQSRDSHNPNHGHGVIRCSCSAGQVSDVVGRYHALQTGRHDPCQKRLCRRRAGDRRWPGWHGHAGRPLLGFRRNLHHHGRQRRIRRGRHLFPYQCGPGRWRQRQFVHPQFRGRPVRRHKWRRGRTEHANRAVDGSDLHAHRRQTPGTVKETGAAASTAFSNISFLQGGGSADTFQFKTGASLSVGLDGGGGANTIIGPAISTTYTVNGSDAGTVAGINFSHVGKLQGVNGVSDQFTVLSNSAALSVGIDGGTGAVNTLTGPGTGATFEITGRDSGHVGSVSFSLVGQLIGADSAADTFVVDAGASLSTGLDGGAGGGNQLVGPDTGAAFTVSSLDGGRIQETGAAVSTVFKNVGQLQGGAGTDNFVLTAAGSLSTGIDGGGGVNAITGPAVSTTFTVSGIDAGTVAGINFTHIAAQAPTAFRTSSTPVEHRRAVGRYRWRHGGCQYAFRVLPATFEITGRDSGRVGGVSFTHVGQVVGADNAPDVFIADPGASLSTGLDGGAGGGTSSLVPIPEPPLRSQPMAGAFRKLERPSRRCLRMSASFEADPVLTASC